MKRKTSILWMVFMLLGTYSYSQEWSLERCIDTALINNKKIKMGVNEQNISVQKRKEASSNLIPKLSLNGDYKYYFDLPTQLMPLSAFGGPDGKYNAIQFGVEHNINANIQLNMPLYKPEIYGGIKATKIAMNVADLKTEQTKEEIILNVSNLYYNAQIVKNQLQFIDSNLVNINVLLEHVTLFQSQGLAMQNDVDKVQLQKQQLQINQQKLENNYKQIIMGLNLLMGLPLENEIEVEENVVHIASAEYSTQKPLNLRLLEARYSLVNSEIQTLNRTRFLPSAYLYGSYGVMGYGYDRKPNDFLDFYNMGFAGVKVTYPLFNGTTTLRKVNQKKLELENYSMQKELLNDQTNLEIDKAKMDRQLAEETLLATDSQLLLAKSIYEKTVLQHKEGTLKLTDVLLADNSVREAQQSYITAIVDYLKADLILKQITGNIK